MQPHSLSRAALLLMASLFSINLIAQVKIGIGEKKEPHPSAVLELQSADRGFLLPRLTQKQMLDIKEPADALVVYNIDLKSIFIFSIQEKQWLPLLQQTQRLGNDSCEWEFDSTTARVFLVRGYPIGDSIYYTTDTKQFIFSDRTTNTNSIGQDFPVTAFTGKYYFKATASRFTDSTNLNPTGMSVIFEIDSSGANTFFRGMQIATVNNPKNLGKLDFLSSLQISTIHAGRDSVTSINGFTNSTTVNGTGATSSLVGIVNTTRIADSATQNVFTMSGIRNSILNTSPSTRISSNVFGYFGSTFFLDSNGAGTIDGNLYGVFLSNIAGAAPKRNYAFYSNRGHNRFGDSTLITDAFAISPRAVLDVNSTSAMITPAGTIAQRPATPVAAMLRFNTVNSNMEFFDGALWKTFSSDSAEWVFEPGTGRVNLVRGLLVNDTIFYSPSTRKFVFSDRYTNTNSLGQDFPVDAFNGKYTFKSTASQRTDTTLLDGAVINVVYEVDNASVGTFFNTLSTSAVMNPKAFQKADQLSGISNTTIHAGNDSVQFVNGINNSVRNSGNGRSGSITGIQNSVRIANGTDNNTGEIVGIRNLLGRSGTTAGRITGNVYGFLGSFTGFANNVDGTIYGIFLNTVSGAAPKKNYAYYSNKGHNRLGDSTLITDGFTISPRAVLDVNATSAMIVPTGTTAQRPVAGVIGMMRYNTSNQTVETFSGSQWNGIIRGSVSINIPNTLAAAGNTLSVTVTGATTGSAVSVSPDLALPNGIVIAWARVSALNTVEIRFENNSTVSVDPATQTFNIRVIQ
jgi:hypothetical protein